MIEVPSLLFELDALLPRVDFVSVGSNDLLQYLFAADRNNTRVASRYDILSAPPLRALASHRGGGEAPQPPAQSVRRDGGPAAGGDGAGRPGYRSISMAPASVGPVKSMVLSLDVGALERWFEGNLRASEGSLRAGLKRFAEEHGVEI